MSLAFDEQAGSEHRAGRPLTPGEVERAVRAVDPTVFFVLPRVLRRVIAQDCRLTGFAMRVPHRKSYAIGASRLLEIVKRSELRPNDDAEFPDRVILLPSPEERRTSQTPAGEVLAYYWRLLFHMRVHAAFDQRVAQGDLTPAAMRERIQAIGPAEFDEIRLVLQQESFLLPPSDDLTCYIEFAAVYLELRHFAPTFASRYFPGLAEPAAVDAILSQDVDFEALFLTTRPSGASEPKDRCEIDHWSEGPEDVELPDDEPNSLFWEISAAKCLALMRRARRPAAAGNVVRAAIYRARAERVAPPEMIDRVRADIETDVFHLIRRLQAALELDTSVSQPWHDALRTLVRQTPQGLRTTESRLLYDLQKACVDHERGIFTIDVVEWAISFGRRPIKRPLPHQRDVLMARHLRSAARHLAVVHLTPDQRDQLARLLDDSIERVEARLREQLRPVVASALDEVGLTPKNVPEIVARNKLVEELLDQIVESGFLTMGGLRDAISRNNLKLPDISEPSDFLHGDQLLRADERLAVALDGVYYSGEFYLRGMQRLSALAFGTGIGRFVTRFAAVPFGGAYLALAGLNHLMEKLIGLQSSQGDATVAEGVAALGEAGSPHLRVTSPLMILALGLLLVGLINSAGFRQAVVGAFSTAYRILRTVIVDPVRWVVHSALFQLVFHSRLFAISLRFLIKPMIWTGAAWWSLPLNKSTWQTSAGSATAIFLAINLLLNSPLGRNFEELIVDWLVQTWHRYGLRIITGLFWFVVDEFKRFLETIEWLMYTVDEWLRFRSGQSLAILGFKAVLGIVWFFVAYVLRFSVNLLIEPQINPIKHFPVVTVSHKLLWPLVPSLAGVLETTVERGWAVTIATTVIFCVPGIFGFLVWELKENWRLYAANRRKLLGPVPIGSHGETMARFLKPGFHSGTLPKRFAKLRRAERKARAGGNWRAVRKHVHALEHVERSIRRHVEREFDQLFAESRCWQGPPIVVEEIQVGATSVRMAFRRPDGGDPAMQVVIALQSGWLVADLAAAGGLSRLLPHQREVLTTALIGLYKSAGVDLVRQQIAAAFHPAVSAYDVSQSGLVIWPQRQCDVEVLYDLRNGEWIAPQAVAGLARRSLPTLERQQLVFGEVPVTWERWVEVWQLDVAGRGHPRNSAAPVCVLP